MNVFITGITGTLGSALAQWHHDHGDTVYGCARNETLIVQHRATKPWSNGIFCHDASAIENSLTFCGQELDKPIDRIYHCAAMKHVEHCEARPDEAIAQNITVLESVLEACRCYSLIFISSDKSCLPSNSYGATKLLGERLVTAAGHAAIRLGNLIGSSGSVLQKWKAAADRGEEIQLTDPQMTRYFIPIHQAVELAATRTIPGRVIVADMKAIRMGVVASLFPRWKIIGPRPGERKHEWSIAPGESYVYRDGVWAIGEGHVSLAGRRSDEAEEWTLEDFARELQRVGCLPETANKYQFFS